MTFYLWLRNRSVAAFPFFTGIYLFLVLLLALSAFFASSFPLMPFGRARLLMHGPPRLPSRTTLIHTSPSEPSTALPLSILRPRPYFRTRSVTGCFAPLQRSPSTPSLHPASCRTRLWRRTTSSTSAITCPYPTSTPTPTSSRSRSKVAGPFWRADNKNDDVVSFLLCYSAKFQLWHYHPIWMKYGYAW